MVISMLHNNSVKMLIILGSIISKKHFCSYELETISSITPKPKEIEYPKQTIAITAIPQILGLGLDLAFSTAYFFSISSTVSFHLLFFNHL